MDEHRRCRIIVQCALMVVKVTYRGVHSVYVVICHHEDICLEWTIHLTERCNGLMSMRTSPSSKQCW